MRKQARRKPVTGLTPYEKAVVRRAWEADVGDASIHAFMGMDVIKFKKHSTVRIAGRRCQTVPAN